MGIRKDIKDTGFYNELTEEKQKEFFSVTEKKFVPAIDNIYYSLILEDDYNGNTKLEPLFERLDELKKSCTEQRRPAPFGNSLLVELMSYDIYKYCISNPDLYDIFLVNYLPNESTPRIQVQLRAYGLWNYGPDKMLADSYNSVLDILGEYGMTVKSCRENRLDYCYHTNAIQKPERIFSDKNINNQMQTTMERWHQTGHIENENGKAILKKDYFSLGNRKSNNVFIRFYNKALEVIEQGYKGFFFEIWQQNGLISEYDKYCYEKALEEKNYGYIHKAKLEFYMAYGSDANVKKEFKLTMEDKNSTYRDFEELAAQHMPELTTVFNVEFETKRKFYYYSDEFIDSILQTAPERDGVPEPLKRIYKITDNRKVFLKYLTSKTVCFVRKFENKKPVYAAWWERLRNTKMDSLNVDVDLVRDYSSNLDAKLVKKRFVNSVVTSAVYAGKVESDFVEDIADLLANLNDNDAFKMRVAVYRCDNGKMLHELYGEALAYYDQKKRAKYQKLKNRIQDKKMQPSQA